MSLSCFLNLCNSLLVTIIAEHHSFFHLARVFLGSTLFFRQPEYMTMMAFLGICFKFPRFLFWTSTRIEYFFCVFLHVCSSKSSPLLIRGSCNLCPRSKRWKIKPTALIHTALAEDSLLSHAFRILVPSLIFSAVHNSCFFKLSLCIWFHQMFS